MLIYSLVYIYATAYTHTNTIYTQLRIHMLYIILLLLFSHSVMSDSLPPYTLQHARLPCPSPSPGTCWNSCPLNRWCHMIISSPAVPFFSCLQPFPVSRSFLVSWLFPSSGQSTGDSVSASVLPTNIQSWFPLGLTGLSLCCPRDSQESSPTPQLEALFFSAQLSLWSKSNIHTWLLEKNRTLTTRTSVG